MAKAQMSSIDASMGENSDGLERFRYPWLDLYLAENFIWIGSLRMVESVAMAVKNPARQTSVY